MSDEILDAAFALATEMPGNLRWLAAEKLILEIYGKTRRTEKLGAANDPAAGSRNGPSQNPVQCGSNAETPPRMGESAPVEH